jgi:hypothetical protein
VEPEHRLVVGTLERRWNAALERVQGVEQRLATLTTEHERHRVPARATLLALAEDFPRVWTDATTDMRTKKRIVRLLVEEIIATSREEPSPQVELIMHWRGGKRTRLTVPRNRTRQHRWCTEQVVVDVAQDGALPSGAGHRPGGDDGPCARG